MRTIFTFLFIASLSAFTYAQNIANSDFENWSNIDLFEDPQGLATTNIQSFLVSQVANVTKSTDSRSGSYAAKLETKIIGQDTIFGMISNSQLDNDFNGGVPFTSKPDTFRISAKYAINTGDTAIAFVAFKKMGSFIGLAMQQFIGASTSYTDFKAPITWIIPGITPDSMLFIVVSSNPDASPSNGSWIVVDDIKFDNTLIPGGGFESWIMRSYEEADDWHTWNIISAIYPPPYATKSTDAYNGNYAMKITTRLLNNNQDTISHISNGRIFSDDFSGGMRVNSNPMKVTGYYKYTPVGFDSALVAVRAYGFNQGGSYVNIENNLIKLAPASSYTYFEINLSYNAWPWVDTLGIAFASSNIYDGQQWVKDGSVLLIDSLNIEYFPVGFESTEVNSSLNVYPNPASDNLYFDINTHYSKSTILVYDMMGKTILEKELFDNNIDVSNLANGVYFYKLILDDNIYQGRFNIHR